MKLKDVKTRIKELLDGREFLDSKLISWINNARDEIYTDYMVVGTEGLYFLYQYGVELEGGSVAYNPETEEGRFYLLPDDFVSLQTVYFEDTVIPPLTNPQMVSWVKMQWQGESAEFPTYWVVRGNELEFIPPTKESGKRIFIDYYSKMPVITENTDDGYEDEFMKDFPDYHYYGGALQGAGYLGNLKLITLYQKEIDRIKIKIKTYNKVRNMQGKKPRFMTERELESRINLLNPDFYYNIRDPYPYRRK